MRDTISRPAEARASEPNGKYSRASESHRATCQDCGRDVFLGDRQQTLKQPLTEDQIAEIREKPINPVTLEPGFRHYFAISGASGELGSFHAWDSRQDGSGASASDPGPAPGAAGADHVRGRRRAPRLSRRKGPASADPPPTATLRFTPRLARSGAV